MLASDLNNPEFAGAINPDSRLAVRFYSKPMQNNFRTAQEGRPIFEDRDFVRIEVPGDRTSIIDTFAMPEHQERFPIQWARYKNNKGDPQEVGTPLSQWPLITASQAEELKALKFRTVDAIATASDAQLQNIGMIGGMAPTAMRLRAQAFLAAAKDTAFPQNQAAEIAKRDEEIAEMKAQIARLNEIAMAPPAPEEAPRKRRGAPKGGWPKKKVEEAST